MPLRTLFTVAGAILLGTSFASADLIVEVRTFSTSEGIDTRGTDMLAGGSSASVGFPAHITGGPDADGNSWEAGAHAEKVTLDDHFGPGKDLDTVEFKFYDKATAGAAAPPGGFQVVGSRAVWTDTITAPGATGDVDLVFDIEGMTSLGGGAWEFHTGDTNISGGAAPTFDTSDLAGDGSFTDTYTKTVTPGVEFTVILESRVYADTGEIAEADFESTITLGNLLNTMNAAPLSNATFASGITFAAVPEPSSFLLLAAMGGIGGVIRRRRRPAIA